MNGDVKTASRIGPESDVSDASPRRRQMLRGSAAARVRRASAGASAPAASMMRMVADWGMGGGKWRTGLREVGVRGGGCGHGGIAVALLLSSHLPSLTRRPHRTALRRKNQRFAGRSARRRIRYGYQWLPYGTYTRTG